MSLWHRIIGFFTDDALARENMREVEEILTEILRRSRGDGDFDKVLRQVLEARSPGSSFYRLPRFKSFLRGTYQRKEPPADWFEVAEYVLGSLPEIYGLPREEHRNR